MEPSKRYLKTIEAIGTAHGLRVKTPLFERKIAMKRMICLLLAVTACLVGTMAIRNAVRTDAGTASARMLSANEMSRIRGAGGTGCPECTIMGFDHIFGTYPPYNDFSCYFWLNGEMAPGGFNNICEYTGCVIGDAQHQCATPVNIYTNTPRYQWVLSEAPTPDGWYLVKNPGLPAAPGCYIVRNCVT